MATLDDGAKIVADNVFQRRVGMAVYFVARQILLEAPTTPDHELRMRTAQQIMASPIENVLKYAALVVTNEAIASKPSAVLGTGQASISDQEILAAVREVWNPLSGVV